MIEKQSERDITTRKTATYFLMTEDEAEAEMKRTIEDAKGILALECSTTVRLIMSYLKWDIEALNTFFDDQEKIFQTLGIANPYLSPSLQWDPRSPGIVQMESPFSKSGSYFNERTCRTCNQEKPSNDFVMLACRHQHCLECFRNYLKFALADYERPKAIPCPSRCIQMINDEHIFQLIHDDENLAKSYRKYLINCFVQSNPLLQWCPGRDCSTIAKMKNYNRFNSFLIHCDNCETEFCFNCTQPWHEPLQCSVLKKWNQKNVDESMNAQWLTANTKMCPSCSTSIEKNGGCQHMTCRKPGCGYEFCWLCAGIWKQHNAAECNKFVGRDQTDITRVQTELRRYAHYFERFNTNYQSMQQEYRLKERLQTLQTELEKRSYSYEIKEILEKAFIALRICRRTLTYTFPFAYYLKSNNEAIIFDDNQANLFDATETLARIFEADSTFPEDFKQIRSKISFCQERSKVLLEHCKDGYEKRVWQGLDPY